MPDNKTPHPSNARATIPDDPGAWFGFEQEYFLYKDGEPLGFPPGGGFPPPQGEYYTAVGYKNVGCIAREIVDTHLDLCLDAGINHEGINSEVAKGQWEFQIFGKGSKNAADQVWVARYLLMRLCEKYGVDVNWHCKPLGKDVAVSNLIGEALLLELGHHGDLLRDMVRGLAEHVHGQDFQRSDVLKEGLRVHGRDVPSGLPSRLAPTSSLSSPVSESEVRCPTSVMFITRRTS